VLEAWAGLGYYARARNLHSAAGILVQEGFPTTEAGWRRLPGVGAYTAAAIAAIADNEPTNVVDGNVERVMARLHAIEAPIPSAKARLLEHAGALVTDERPGDWAQALMDLGATVCTPKSPQCGVCPWTQFCAAHSGGAPETFPRRAAKSVRPERFGVAFRVERDSMLWLVRRPEQGLLGGMAALPSTPWRDTLWTRAEAVKHAPAKARWVHVGDVRHVFTHFVLTLSVYRANANPESDGWWGEARGLPTVFKKVALL
jgi:A/G-specific adenine glycosylase